ncbi:MAG TPA: efflux RND transporter permease subunit [Planctomycetes bacterium]|nr:efflux RND transporter permease subunit [Planctomycetota bacterium]
MSDYGENLEHHIPTSLTSRIVKKFLDSNFSVLLILLSLGLGLVALWATPREEDPQIVVPVIDILIESPGTTAQEAQKLTAEPLERMLWEIKGVEHIYSMTAPGRSVITVRFFVGEDREKALINVYNKLEANQDLIPSQVSRWIVKPVEIDDVPILAMTLYSATRGEDQLVRFADEIAARLQDVPDTSKIKVIGGHRRAVRVLMDPLQLEARGLSAFQILKTLGANNRKTMAGTLLRKNRELQVQVGSYLRSAREVGNIIVGIHNGHTVQLRDVARILDGPEEPKTYTRIRFGPAAPSAGRGDPVEPVFLDGQSHPAVTIAVAKRRGTNAVEIAEKVLERFEELRADILPPDIKMMVTRDYGETANEKVNELIGHLLIAVGTIVVLVGASLGWSAAFIVALAVPLTLAVTLFGDLVVGYTINRVTLFALILSLGLLVDDPIVDVENIHRHLMMNKLPPKLATLVAVDEVRPPTILATFAVMVSFLPMFFVTGMMGPYMAPMPFNVPVAMLLSLVIAFTVTPWASYLMLRHEAGKHKESEHGIKEGLLLGSYRKTAHLLFNNRVFGFLFLLGVGVAFLGSIYLAVGMHVPMKMLPFDNKSEFQVIVDAPEGFSLERTARAVRKLEKVAIGIKETTDVTSYIGNSSPHDFNGLVRHYFMRKGSNVADLRINLLPRHARKRQSHEIVLASRRAFEKVARSEGVKIKIVETPPGPPVLAGVVAEVYSPPEASPEDLFRVARSLEKKFEAIPYLRDIDTWIEDDRPEFGLKIDRQRAALRGVDPVTIQQSIAVALSGIHAGAVHAEGERQELKIMLELDRPDRSVLEDLLRLQVPSRTGKLVPLAEMVQTTETTTEKTLFRKDLRDVMYVTAEPVGESPVNAIFQLWDLLDEDPLPEGYKAEFAGEGEWQVTVDVFRDLGLAFAAAMAGIYILLVAQIGSFAVSGLIMLAIPLTMIGIFPGFWLLNHFMASTVDGFASPIYFTATGMIGMIALAGIVVRNSIILIDFIQHHEGKGLCAEDACVEAGVVRLRPILLTAGAAVMGAWVIVFDPIFSGLAWSFVFGIIASTVFTVMVIPLVYILTSKRKRKHMLQKTEA